MTLPLDELVVVAFEQVVAPPLCTLGARAYRCDGVRHIGRLNNADLQL
jgi:hypothetical protein